MRFLFSLLFVVVGSPSVLGQWTQTSGPIGAQSDEIFYVENYLIANSIHGGIFRSSDKGLTWENVSSGLPPGLRCYALNIDNTNLYVATSTGVFYSSDYGDSWESISEPNVVGFSIEASGNEIFVGFHNGLLYYSNDHGNSWNSRYTNPFQETIRYIHKFGNKLWIGSDRNNLIYSPDGSGSWYPTSISPVVTGIYDAGGDLFVSGNNGLGVFTLYRSTDQGVSWTSILSTGENNVAASGFLKDDNEIIISGANHWVIVKFTDLETVLAQVGRIDDVSFGLKDQFDALGGVGIVFN